MENKKTLSSAKIASLSKKGSWGQAFSFDNLYCSLEVSGPENFETPLLGKQLIEELQNNFVKNEVKDLNLIKNLINLLVRKAESSKVKISASICFLKNSILYLATVNKARVYIKRQEKLSAILSGKAEIETASGFLQEDDRIILSTEKFDKIINEEKLNIAVDNRSPQEVADILAPDIQSQEEFSGVGMIIKVDSEEAKTAEPQDEVEDLPQPVINIVDEIGTPQPPIIEAEIPIKRNLLKDKFSAFKEKLNQLKNNFRISSLTHPIFIHESGVEQEKKKKVTKTIAIILMFLLVLTVVFNLQKRTNFQNQSEFTKAYDLANNKYKEGKALIDLNPNRAKVLLSEGKDSLLSVKDKVIKNKDLSLKLEELLTNISSNLEVVSAVYRLKDLSLFFDLSSINTKFEAKAINLQENKLIVFDKFSSNLYLINLDKSHDTLGKIASDGKSLAVINNETFLLTTNAIYQVNITSGKSLKAVTIDQKKEDIGDLANFNSNLYLLDKQNSVIWKQVLGDAGLSSPISYLKEGIKPDFSDAVSIGIDGSIYILKLNGEVLKFLQGSPQTFSLTGLDKNLSNPVQIYTSETLNNLYILDPVNSRVVIFNKNGEYQSQYVNSSIKNISKIIVSGDEKTIYLLSSSRIYQIAVK